MPQFAEITLSNTNLTGVTNFFTLDVKECTQSTFTTIETGLTYSDFPYFVNLEQEFGPIDCFNYKVSESYSGLICSGQTFAGSPTPSPSVTVTPSITPSVTVTNTPTPTPSVSSQTAVTLNMGVEYESGSTVAIYSFTASTNVNQDTTVKFSNVVYENDGTEHRVVTGVTISSGSNIGTTTVTLENLNYRDLKPYELVYSGITSKGVQFGTYNKTAKVKYKDKDSPIWAPYTFRGCCPKRDGDIVVYVTQDALVSGGWVTLGGVIIYDGKCYSPHQLGGSNAVGYYYGADFKNCASISSKVCLPCPSPSVTPTPSKTSSVTPSVTPTITTTVTPTITNSITPTVTPTPSFCHDGLDCYTELCSLDCYSYAVEPSPSPTPTITTTPSPTPTISITPTTTITPSITQSPVSPSVTPTVTVTPSITPSNTPSTTVSPSVTPSNTPSTTVSPSVTPTSSLTPSITPTTTVSPSVTPTSSLTPSITPTTTVSPSVTPTVTVSTSVTPTYSPTPTPTVTPSTSSVITHWRLSGCCTTQDYDINYVTITGGTPSVTDGFEYNGVYYALAGTYTSGDITLGINDLTSNYCDTVTCPSVTPTPTMSVTATPTVTPSVTPTMSITPSITPTVTPSSVMNYYTTWACGEASDDTYPVISIDEGANTGSTFTLDSGQYSGYCVNILGLTASTADTSATVVDDCNSCTQDFLNYRWNFGHTFTPSGSTQFTNNPNDPTLGVQSVTGCTHVLIGRYSSSQDNYNYLNNLTGTSKVELTDDSQSSNNVTFTVTGSTYYTPGSNSYFALGISNVDSYSPDDTPFGSATNVDIKIIPNI
jgi:hypothetical protein